MASSGAAARGAPRRPHTPPSSLLLRPDLSHTFLTSLYILPPVPLLVLILISLYIALCIPLSLSLSLSLSISLSLSPSCIYFYTYIVRSISPHPEWASCFPRTSYPLPPSPASSSVQYNAIPTIPERNYHTIPHHSRHTIPCDTMPTMPYHTYHTPIQGRPARARGTRKQYDLPGFAPIPPREAPPERGGLVVFEYRMRIA